MRGPLHGMCMGTGQAQPWPHTLTGTQGLVTQCRYESFGKNDVPSRLQPHITATPAGGHPLPCRLWLAWMLTIMPQFPRFQNQPLPKCKWTAPVQIVAGLGEGALMWPHSPSGARDNGDTR